MVQRFTGTLVEMGTRVVIPVPFEPNAVWGAKERHHVTGTIAGQRVRAEIESGDIGWFISMGAARRQCGGLKPGDSVEVALEPEGPSVSNVAADIAAALESDPPSMEFFEGLPTFYRKNFMRWIDSARRPETRAARIAEMMELLKARRREK
ncbi:MAG TPA: YdeI/OmpD-associated family protein [Chthonomonadaceae bacterium]|nr:YdeI/OmpD-associated family protein [Chthonomonadaceae bacterium]